MKLRLTPNTWVLIVLLGIVVVIGSETARAYLKGDSGQPPPEPVKTDPDFKVGDLAPDFTLPDKDGKRHSLASLVKGDTLLCFICGCHQCRQAQTYLGQLNKKLGPKAPRVISVSTTDPEAEEAYKRDVPLAHLMLYDRKVNPEDASEVDSIYHGHPCPRMFRLTGERKVAWIGKSPSQLPGAEMGLMELARVLGFRLPGEKGKTGPQAPPPPTPEMAPKPLAASIQTVPATEPGHSH